ncbi:hypothetical protein G7054_g3812 [Neopestalotiopsis clavispora]|nr:hypothetical protein G7054_g3812 [Neopestalotiopsis clavispora]
MALVRSRPTLAEAIKVTAIGSNAYSVDLSSFFAVGKVPNGGYVAACILEAASIHLSARQQADTLIAHFEFMDRTEIGSAVILIDEVKNGRRLSLIHATLYQQDLLSEAPWVSSTSSRKKILAYVTNGNLEAERGLSLPTDFRLDPNPQAVNLQALARGADENWCRRSLPPEASFNPSMQACEFYVPRQGQIRKSLIDHWIRLPEGQKFTNTSLGYVVDCWPYVVEAYRSPGSDAAKTNPQALEAHSTSISDVYWYPTVTLNMEIKKALPKGGVDWLFMRVNSRQIKNGRLDLEVLILDESGDLLALSQHVNLIVGIERNTNARGSL